MMAAILVIEDDIELQGLVSHALASDGYDVRLTGDGEEGLALCRELGPDLLILDAMTPQADGLATLRGQGEPPACPVLILTAEAGEDAWAGTVLGGYERLAKPFMTAELRARVRSLLRRLE